MTYYMPFKGGIGLLFLPTHGTGTHIWCLRCEPWLAPWSLSHSCLPCMWGPPGHTLAGATSSAALPLPITPLPRCKVQSIYRSQPTTYQHHVPWQWESWNGTNVLIKQVFRGKKNKVQVWFLCTDFLLLGQKYRLLGHSILILIMSTSVLII